MPKKAKNPAVIPTASSDKLKDQKLEALKIAMQQIDRQYGEGSIMRLGESQKLHPVSAISTGSIALDIALGIGGLPRGRIIEIYGPEASGKTTLALHVIAQAQKNGGTAAFIDAEHALDAQRAAQFGVNLDELLLSQPDTGEQGLEITDTLIRSGAIDVVVIDSVAALVPKAEIEGEMGDSMMGVQARLMSQALRKLTGAISKSKAVVIFTNQLREKIGVMFGNPEVTAGGKALKFYASVRIDMRKIGNIQEGDVIIGSRHRAKIVKNKVSPPFRSAEFDIMNAGGISREGGVIDVAVEENIIQKAGAFLKYKGVVIGQGREAAKIALSEKPELLEELEAEIKAKATASPEKTIASISDDLAVE
jgi:recombination protein RecA